MFKSRHFIIIYYDVGIQYHYARRPVMVLHHLHLILGMKLFMPRQFDTVSMYK